MLRVDVKPDLLRWARDRSGNTIDTLSDRFPKLRVWERGDDKPTLKQLEAYARATHTPIGFLFLATPPVERIPIPDFRTMAGTRFERASPDLLETIYLCQHRQEWYRDCARANAEGPLAFVGSAKRSNEVVDVAASIRSALGLDPDERRRLRTWEEALRRLAERADAIGVLVMVSGIVGSNTHRPLDPEEFRGFALSDPMAPLVFVNGADTKAAQMFTLAHELAHIWLGESAVSDTEASEVPVHEVERWCNQVAAEMLVPLEIVRGEVNHGAPLVEEAQRLARHFKVSTLVVLRRIHDTGAIGQKAFWAAYRAERARLVALPKSKIEWRRLLRDPGSACRQVVGPCSGRQRPREPHHIHRGLPTAWHQEADDLRHTGQAARSRSVVSYLLDANVFIAAKRLHYGFDFCPAFWDWLVVQNEAGRVFSIERVGTEVATGADDLSIWADARGASFFLPADAAMLASFGQVSTWVMGRPTQHGRSTCSPRRPTATSWRTRWRIA